MPRYVAHCGSTLFAIVSLFKTIVKSWCAVTQKLSLTCESNRSLLTKYIPYGHYLTRAVVVIRWVLTALKVNLLNKSRMSRFLTC